MTERSGEVIEQAQGLVAWAGEGRKLTQTDRLTLADARYLVEALGTGDRIDPVYHGTVSKTKSSAELGGLSELVEWTKAAGLVRAVKHRLMPVKKHTKTVEDAEALRRALFRGLAAKNFAVAPEYAWRPQTLMEIDYDLGFDIIASILYVHPGALSIPKIAEAVWDTLSPRWVLTDRTAVQLETLRRWNDKDVRTVLERLSWLGSVILSGDTVTLTSLGRGDLARRRGEPEPGAAVLRLRVELLEVDRPEVWRRIDIAPASSLAQLHAAIQAAMGWKDSHPHAFAAADGTEYGPRGAGDELGLTDETSVTVAEALKPGAGLDYTYDFGDGWSHRVSLELAAVAEEGRAYPYCADGAGACPPEDCGSPPGYAELKAVLAGPPSARQAELIEWLDLAGTEFEPSRFDRDLANKQLRVM